MPTQFDNVSYCTHHHEANTHCLRYFEELPLVRCRIIWLDNIPVEYRKTWSLRPTLCTSAFRLLHCRDDTIKGYENEPVHELCAIVKEISGDIQKFFELICHIKYQVWKRTKLEVLRIWLWILWWGSRDTKEEAVSFTCALKRATCE